MDLETICLKCLHPDASKRYATAGELAADLGHFIAREPITARPVTKFEKIRMWCRRRPIQTALSVALALAMILGLAGIFVEWRRAEIHAVGESHERLVAEDYARKIRLDLYAADINVSAQAIGRGDYGQARRTLAALQTETRKKKICAGLNGVIWRNLTQGSQLVTLAGHDWIVTCAAFSADGTPEAGHSGGQ